MASKKVQHDRPSFDLGISQPTQQPSSPPFDLGVPAKKHEGEDVKSESSRSKRKMSVDSVVEETRQKRGRPWGKSVLHDEDDTSTEDSEADSDDSDGSFKSDDDDETVISEGYDSPGLTQQWNYINTEPFARDIRFACSTNKNIFSMLKKKLSRVSYDMFLKTCFGIYKLIPDMSHQGPIHRVIFESVVTAPNKDQLWVAIGRKILKFTLLDFGLITGLRCNTNEEDFDYDGQPTCRLIRRYFPGRETVTKTALNAAFQGKIWENNHDDGLKFGILVFIANFLFSLSPDARISTKFFYVVDCGHYSDYPWGKAVFKELMRCYNKPVKRGQRSYRLLGMPYALQCWIYECCSDVPDNVAKHVKEDVPRILNWEVRAKNLMYSDVKANLFEQAEFENIFPFMNEYDTLPLPIAPGFRPATRTPEAGPSNLRGAPSSTAEAEAAKHFQSKRCDSEDDAFQNTPPPRMPRRSSTANVPPRSNVKRTARKNVSAKIATHSGRGRRNEQADDVPDRSDHEAEASPFAEHPNEDIPSDGAAMDAEPVAVKQPQMDDHLDTSSKGRDCEVRGSTTGATSSVAAEDVSLGLDTEHQNEDIPGDDAAIEDEPVTVKQPQMDDPLDTSPKGRDREVRGSTIGATSLAPAEDVSLGLDTEILNEGSRPVVPDVNIDDIIGNVIEDINNQFHGDTSVHIVLETFESVNRTLQSDIGSHTFVVQCAQEEPGTATTDAEAPAEQVKTPSAADVDGNVDMHHGMEDAKDDADMPTGTSAPVEAAAIDLGEVGLEANTPVERPTSDLKEELRLLRKDLFDRMDQQDTFVRLYVKKKFRKLKKFVQRNIINLGEHAPNVAGGNVAGDGGDEGMGGAGHRVETKSSHKRSEHYTGDMLADDEDVATSNKTPVSNVKKDAVDATMLDVGGASASSWNNSPYAARFDLTAEEMKVIPPSIALHNPLVLEQLSEQDVTNIEASFRRWLEDGLLVAHKSKFNNQDHYKHKCAQMYGEMDFVVAFPGNKNWFYIMAMPGVCWTDEQIEVIFYYLRKKAKFQSKPHSSFTTMSCFFKTKVDEMYARHMRDQMDTSIFRDNDDICNYMKGLSLPAATSWDSVEDVYIPVNCRDRAHWVLAVISLRLRSISIYDSMCHASKQHRAAILSEVNKIAKIIPYYLQLSGFFDRNDRFVWNLLDAYSGKSQCDPLTVKYEENIPQQKFGTLDCGVFVAAFAELLSDGACVQDALIDADKYRVRYGALLWNYGVKKYADGYKSENDDPPRFRRRADGVGEPSGAVDLDLN